MYESKFERLVPEKETVFRKIVEAGGAPSYQEICHVVKEKGSRKWYQVLGLQSGEEPMQAVDRLLDEGRFEEAYGVACSNECCAEVKDLMQMYLFTASLAHQQASQL